MGRKPIPLPLTFPWPWWVSVLIAVLIALPFGYLLLHSPFLALFSFVWLPVWAAFCWAEERDLVLRYGEAYEACRWPLSPKGRGWARMAGQSRAPVTRSKGIARSPSTTQP